MKKKGAFKDTWTAHLCEYHPDTQLLQVKSNDNKNTRWEKVVLKAWALDVKPNRRQHRFDVRTSDDETLAFAGSSQSDMDQWIDVSEKRYWFVPKELIPWVIIVSSFKVYKSQQKITMLSSSVHARRKTIIIMIFNDVQLSDINTRFLTALRNE